MIKVLLILILVLIIILTVLALIIKSQNKTINFQNIQLNENTQTIQNKDKQISQIMEEMEIEKNYNKQLAKKLADISCMSIDDVIKQLQK